MRLDSIKERESKWYFKTMTTPDHGHAITVGFIEGLKFRDEQAVLEYKHDKEFISDISDEHRTLSKWLNEEIDSPVDKKALAKVLAAIEKLKRSEN